MASNAYASDHSGDSDNSASEGSSSSPKGSEAAKVEVAQAAQVATRLFWDPLDSRDWDLAGALGHLASARIRRDISSIFKDPIPGVLAVPDEKNLCLINCLIIGPIDTPYEGGFFHFYVRFGPSYPMHPPRVRMMTTDGGYVRFNPNFYSSGTVCLSILGTWTGPGWSPASNLGSLLISIQSILNDKPYFNEPMFPKERYFGQSDNYNTYLTYETLRVGVCQQMEFIVLGSHNDRVRLPKEVHPFMKTAFLEYYDHYEEMCRKYQHLDNEQVKCPYDKVKKKYNFSAVLVRLKNIKICLETENCSKTSSSTNINSQSELDIASEFIDRLDSPLSSLSSISEDQSSETSESPEVADLNVTEATEATEEDDAFECGENVLCDENESPRPPATEEPEKN